MCVFVCWGLGVRWRFFVASNRQTSKNIHVCYISSAFTAAFFRLAPFFAALTNRQTHTSIHTNKNSSHRWKFLKSVNVWIQFIAVSGYFGRKRNSMSNNTHHHHCVDHQCEMRKFIHNAENNIRDRNEDMMWEKKKRNSQLPKMPRHEQQRNPAR